MATQPTHVFWRFGILALALAGLSTGIIRLAGPDSTVALLVLPIFFVVFQVPYSLLAILTEGRGIFGPLFFGSPWLVIPFWALLVFLWNGSVAALIALAWVRFRKRT